MYLGDFVLIFVFVLFKIPHLSHSLDFIHIVYRFNYFPEWNLIYIINGTPVWYSHLFTLILYVDQPFHLETKSTAEEKKETHTNKWKTISNRFEIFFLLFIQSQNKSWGYKAHQSGECGALVKWFGPIETKKKIKYSQSLSQHTIWINLVLLFCLLIK